MSSIEIINRALIKIGEPPIASIKQAPNGESWGYVYEDMKKMLLSSHYWRFAIKRAVLSRLDEKSDAEEFDYVYAIPSDCLQLMKVGVSYKRPNLSDYVFMPDVRYSIEGGKILSNESKKLSISYIANIDNTSLFSKLFREALISRIAAEMSVRLTQKTQIKETLDREFAYFLDMASSKNEILRDIETMPDGSWLTVRGDWANGTY